MRTSENNSELNQLLANLSATAAYESLATELHYNIHGSEQAYFGHGSKLERFRLQLVANYCLSHYPGDLLEIGCFRGETSAFLASVAASYGRRLLCVDPWQLGTQNCNGGEFEAFTKAIAPFANSVDVLRCSSQEEEAITTIKRRPLAFAFVDGLHTPEACAVDIDSVSHCAGIIAVDDIRWHPELEHVFEEKARQYQRKAFSMSWFREGYLL